MSVPTVRVVFDRRRRAGRDKRGSVEICVYWRGRQCYVTTGVMLLRRQWRDGLVVGRPDAFELQRTIDSLCVRVRSVVNDMIEDGAIDFGLLRDRVAGVEPDGRWRGAWPTAETVVPGRTGGFTPKGKGNAEIRDGAKVRRRLTELRGAGVADSGGGGKDPSLPRVHGHSGKVSPVAGIAYDYVRRSGGFLRFCEERTKVRKYGREHDTCDRYDRFLRWLHSWGGIREFSDVTEARVMEMDAALAASGMKTYSKWQNYHRFLNSFILDAVDAGLLRRNPYRWLHIERDKRSHGLERYLTREELGRIERAVLPDGLLCQARDLFVFQSYTCLSYTDLRSFDYSQVREDAQGRLLYTGRRGKTHQEFTFVLFPPAVSVLKRYGGRLPLLDNSSYNRLLKDVVRAAGIDRPVSSHWARHTGATLLLNAGVDMEVVARILGHSSTRITREVYAKLLDETVADAMSAAVQRLGF